MKITNKKVRKVSLYINYILIVAVAVLAMWLSEAQTKNSFYLAEIISRDLYMGEMEVDVKQIPMLKSLKLPVASSSEEKVSSATITCEGTVKIEKMNIDCKHLKTIIATFGRDETLIAIIMQESRFNPIAKNVNKNKSIDRGIYQLNDTYWTFKDGDFDHSTKQAVQCKKDLGYACWWAYRSGDFKQKLPLAKELLSMI